MKEQNQKQSHQKLRTVLAYPSLNINVTQFQNCIYSNIDR